MSKMVKYVSLLVLLGFVATSCATATLTRQAMAEKAKMTGTFNVILLGGTYKNDAERAVILDLEGDKYHFEPVMPSYRIKRKPDESSTVALLDTARFFSKHCAYNGYRVKSLKLADGKLVGYEVTPVYPKALCEYGNTVNVGYKVYGDGEIKVYTSLLLPVGGGSLSTEKTLRREGR